MIMMVRHLCFWQAESYTSMREVDDIEEQSLLLFMD